MKNLNILVLEDDNILRPMLSQILSKYGKIFATGTSEGARELINSYPINLAFVDLHINGKPEGLEIVSILKQKDIYNVVLSGSEDDEIIRQAYESGCNDYYLKGNDIKSVDSIVEKFLISTTGDPFNGFLKEEFITEDQGILEQVNLLKEVRYSNDPVMILGPTGTGKTIVARKIHSLARCQGDFVEINCSAIPENLLESELFGHVKGAFTGASTDKEGLLLKAHKGIIFLDEVGALPLPMQAKLLKALEEKSFTPVGSVKPVTSDFRIVSATCEDLDEYRRNGLFRNDLYFRLSGTNIHLKGLADRPGDINLLITHFLKSSSRKIVISPEAREKINSYAWPGNVRELKKVINILLTREKGLVTIDDLPAFILQKSSESKSEGTLMTKDIKNMARQIGLYETIELLKNEIMKSVSEDNQGKVNKTIQDLKISTNTYYKLIKSEVSSQGLQ